jgi:hypothetical protein
MKRLVQKAMNVLIVDSVGGAELLLRLLNGTVEDQELLLGLLDYVKMVLEKDESAVEIFAKDDIFEDVLRNNDYTRNVCLTAYQIVKTFRSERYRALVSEFSFLDGIDPSKKK